MNIGTLNNVETHGKTVLVRVDFNSPIDPSTNTILDDKRFREHIPTIKSLEDSKVILIAHQSRPGKKDFTTLKAHADHLEKLLGTPVTYVNDIFGYHAKKTIRNSNNGDIILLENLRFNAEENMIMSPDTAANTHFVRNLSSMADIFVNDAFGTAHRSQPSIVGLPIAMKSVAGLLMEKEIKNLSKIFTSAPKPVTFVLGGTKVDDSISVASHVLENGIADNIVVIGIVANVFYLAKNIKIGLPSINLISKLGYDPEIQKANNILEKYGDKIILPEYVAVDQNNSRCEYNISEVPSDCPILDIGSKSINVISPILQNSGTVVFNGPAGMFEKRDFATGTYELLQAASKSKFSICGGGHTASVIECLGIESEYTHISTGGGACIEYLTGQKLPAIDALERSWVRYWQ
ncbi:MAG TPA: phosphoglycerate kinase [Methanocorpusculum sp.]|nr:phosphoglycerate kinase [Methanocorpusculum sp.]